MKLDILFFVVAIVCLAQEVKGHGRLIKPASRGTMWRFGFGTPENYNDNELNCGGFSTQWDENDGKCGMCGDPYQGERAHEAGGTYATGTIAACYNKSVTSIEVAAELTSNHKGYFEYRLCEQNDVSSPITQACLDSHLLTYSGTEETRRYITSSINGNFSFNVDLPVGVTCEQCVLQWKYNAGNNWDCDDNGNCCVGCGPQEQFYGCADIMLQETCP